MLVKLLWFSRRRPAGRCCFRAPFRIAGVHIILRLLGIQIAISFVVVCLQEGDGLLQYVVHFGDVLRNFIR
jgi:hypothetical protein